MKNPILQLRLAKLVCLRWIYRADRALRAAHERHKHNRNVMTQVRDFEKWSAYAKREGHQFIAALFESKATEARRQLRK